MTLPADVATASGEVAGTSSCSRKVTILADLLRRLEADEIPITVGFVMGVPRQGRIGVGYSTIYAVDHARG
jgi:DNA ligase-1